jgi:hypothetical protein
MIFILSDRLLTAALMMTITTSWATPCFLHEELVAESPDFLQIFDGHNDLYDPLASPIQRCNTLPLMPWALRQADFTARSLDLNQAQPQLHTDIARLKQGKVGAQVPWLATTKA